MSELCLTCGPRHTPGEYKCLGCGQVFCYHHACDHYGVQTDVVDSLRREIRHLIEENARLEWEVMRRRQDMALMTLETAQRAD